MSLTSLLPQPRMVTVTDAAMEEEQRSAAAAASAPGAARFVPPAYGRRAGFVPRSLDDFGDGGAFPEIHIQQYPLNMGRKEKRGAKASSTAVVPLSVDGTGAVQFDAVVKQGHDKSVVVHSGYQAMVAKNERAMDLSKPSAEDEARIAEETKAALGMVVDKKIATAMPTHVAKHSKEAVFIKYTPSEQNAAFNSGAQQRIIRLQEMPVDPMQPPKFKHSKLPPGPPDAPVPVMHSPPRKITVEDQKAWAIPPCISNWKNIKGYTVPLEHRLAADGRGLQEVQVNDKFAKLSESLFIAERTARTEIEQRAALNKKMQRKLKEQKEEEFRQLATQAYQQATTADTNERETEEYAGGAGAAGAGGADGGAAASGLEGMRRSLGEYASDEDEAEGESSLAAREAREALRRDRQREIKRDMRLEHKKIEKGTSAAYREQERDVSEKIALGQAPPMAKESMFDQRLYNQDAGLASGFGAADSYDVYSKPLFAHGSSTATLYRPKAVPDMDEDAAAAASMGGSAGGAAASSREPNTSKFKADRAFAGTEHGAVAGGSRSKPVEFERDSGEVDDPYGLGNLLNEARRPSALDKIGSGGAAMGLGRESGGPDRQMQFREGSGAPPAARREERGRSKRSRSRSDSRERRRSRSRSRDRRY